MTSATLTGFAHRWIPGTSGRTLLLLHGTGGDENDLLPLARAWAPADSVLAPRGKVLENGAPRFFRRHAPGVLDLDDLRARAHELADFVREASARYGFDKTRVVAIGYSNGANVAVGLLFERPETLAGAILTRAMLPYEPSAAPALPGRRVLLLAGERDPYAPRATTERLAAILRASGAEVDARVANAGHELTREDLAAGAAWLGRRR